MKNLFLLLTCIVMASSYSQQTTPKEAWLEKWENSKNYLIGIAEAMPESAYSFKPTERQMSFKEHLIHIKGNMDWLSTTYFTDTKFERGKSKLPPTKAETIAILTKAFDNALAIIKKADPETLTETVDFFAGPKSKLQILNLLQDHVTHHRGQLIVYLNMNDVKPPSYSGW